MTISQGSTKKSGGKALAAWNCLKIQQHSPHKDRWAALLPRCVKELDRS